MFRSPTFNDFLVHIYNCKRYNAALKMGQHAYNELYKVRPDLANKLPEELDPFYEDKTCQKFLEWVDEHWDDEIPTNQL